MVVTVRKPNLEQWRFYLMRFKRGLFLLLMLLQLGLFVGCASEKDSYEAPPASNPPPDTTDPNDNDGGTTLSSNSVKLRISSNSRLADYIQDAVNAPSDVILTVSLEANNDGRYGGEIEITFTDSGIEHRGVFTTNGDYPGDNKWVKVTKKKKMFQSILEDEFGAIAFIIEKTENLGDGITSDKVSGSVWYKNHGTTNAPTNPTDTPCWEIEMGPYDCRASFSGNPLEPHAKNDHDSSVDPTEYKKLGTFSGLSRSAAMKN